MVTQGFYGRPFLFGAVRQVQAGGGHARLYAEVLFLLLLLSGGQAGLGEAGQADAIAGSAFAGGLAEMLIIIRGLSRSVFEHILKLNGRSGGNGGGQDFFHA